MESKHEGELKFWRTRFELEKSFDSCTKAMLNKYTDVLGIGPNEFCNAKVIDIGCGPRGTLHEFQADIKIGLDPLSDIYMAEFRMNHDMLYLKAYSEDIPLPSNYMDYVLSVNSLDHVDDVDKTLKEIHRILKPTGVFYACINLAHGSLVTEPHMFTKESIISQLSALFRVNITKEILKSADVPMDRISVRCVKV